ncbi:oxidoreductase domain protein [Kribbella flavida DSM 17836]|uniref:Oxidoreductase domain protein n=1 Tax=Kribbella flavida (strain DSM 17836 / JCM 10339 / NBRC 14399) TaxID=479435 RepID=D2PQV6_KRIFD|nr:oxidoreductase domain protein [Kribbella flavida DSM 17836]
MEPSPRSDGSVRWGVLATGGIARAFTRDLLAHDHRVTAVGSRSLASAESFAAEFGIPRAHGSYEDLVADPEVDVVYIATPHNFHAANAELALEHGKHVLVEKAFTLTGEQAQRVTELGRARGLVVLEAMWTRFLPHMAHVHRLIDSGRLGQVRSVHADHTQRLPQEDEHRINNLRLGGGALLDLGIYPVSFAWDILGRPVDVRARAAFRSSGVDASVATVFEHDGGALSTTYCSSETRGRNTATILGTEGRIEIADTWYAPAPVTLLDNDGKVLDRYDEPVSGRGMQFQAAELERLVTAGDTAGSPLLRPEESVGIMRTMDEIRSQIGLRYPDE